MIASTKFYEGKKKSCAKEHLLETLLLQKKDWSLYSNINRDKILVTSSSLPLPLPFWVIYLTEQSDCFVILILVLSNNVARALSLC